MRFLYPRHPNRKVLDLIGFWDFQFLENVPDTDAPEWEKLTFPDTMNVPGVFDTMPDSAGRRGVGFYRKILETSDTDLLLKLNGLGLRGTVFWDRKRIGVDDLPYVSMEFAFPSGGAGRHELAIAVDNRADFKLSPLFSLYYDYYGHGGIYRDAELQEIPAFSIDRALVTPLSIEGSISVKVLFRGKLPGETTVCCSIDDGASFKKKLTLSDGCAVFELKLENPVPWSPENPALHYLKLETENGDSVVERFGLRIVKAEKGQIFLNDTPLKLKGVCRHETHPQFGPALPDQLLREDIAFLKQLGCNFIRGTHYQQDPKFLDLCDREGLLVWEEGIGWGDHEDHLTDQGFRDAQIRQYDWIPVTSYNNPSVILRGFLNEGDSSNPKCRPLYETLSKKLRLMDPSRPVTYASMYYEKDVCFDLADVISLNAYPGWYAFDRDKFRPLDEIVPCIEKFLGWLSEKGFDDKPFILSEIGAGAIYGWHDRFRVHWSEEYQADYLDVVCSMFESHPRMNGLALWQYCDGRTRGTAHSLDRPRSFNNKGLLDEYRRPKLGFDVVRKHFTAM